MLAWSTLIAYEADATTPLIRAVEMEIASIVFGVVLAAANKPIAAAIVGFLSERSDGSWAAFRLVVRVLGYAGAAWIIAVPAFLLASHR